MTHTRKQIIENQTNFRKEIVQSLTNEFREIKRDLKRIKTEDQLVLKYKKKQLDRTKNLNILSEINKFLISYKNIRPNFYAWWDEINQQVIKLKYEDK